MKKKIVVFSILMMFFVLNIISCQEAYLPPNVSTEVYLAEALVTELNERCQAGDPNACCEGLNKAATTLTLVVDALEGKGSD